MNSSYFEHPSQTIPFNLKGFDGEVSVYYGVNDEPRKTGFDALPSLPFDISLSRGYPVIHARIERYGGTGYRMFCGWIQIITSVFRNSQGRSETLIAADTAPAFNGENIPFAAYGYLPQLFDAPCLNLGGAAELHWMADTFLTTVPMRSKAEEISCLLGFQWGYIENDIPGEKPTQLPLKVTTGQAWNNHTPFLREQFSAWRFHNLE
jgi:hypothetical protein